MSTALERPASLRVIKLVHTVVWAFFVACIFAMPALAARDSFGSAAMVGALVFLEVLVLLLNHWRCPLTDVAARLTTDRRDNFDIYLPIWLARYNKQVFGPIFLAGVVFTLLRWLR